MTSAPLASPVSKRNAATRRRRAFMVVGALLLVAAITVGLWPRAIPVEVATAVRGPLVVTVDEEGMTRVKNRYTVSAPVAGQLRRIDWKAGAAVEAGVTVLATLETSGADFLDARSHAQAEARVKSALANREAAEAQQERAAATAKMYVADFERLKRLFENKVLSAQEFDTAQMRATVATQDVRAAEFARQVAEGELEQARALLVREQPGGNADPLAIRSPVSGRILRVLQESARVVPAGFPLMEVGDPTDLEVRIEVLSRDGVMIRPGARVVLEQWGGAKPLSARVRWVEPSAFTKISALGVEEQRVYVVADFVDPISERATLGDNFRVEARIVTWEAADVLHVPSGALFYRGQVAQVFVLEGGRARVREVKVGHGNGIDTEILEGLSAGDRVVVYPGDKVRAGIRVKPITVTGS